MMAAEEVTTRNLERAAAVAARDSARAALVHGAKSAVAEIGHIRVGVLAFVRALEGPKRDSLVPVLASLLHCSPEETRALWRSVGVEPAK